VRARSSTAAAITLTLLIVGLVAAGCRTADAPATPPSAAFCDAAVRFENRIQRGADIDQQIRLVRRLVDTAPREIKPDARTFLAALEAVREDPDDPALKNDPEVREAVDNLNRFATNGCDLLDQDGGGGSPL